MEQWSKSSLVPGQFTGSTGVQVLPRQELEGPNSGSVWATKDTLKKTKAIEGGIGKHLLKLMGWKEGDGLGKNKQGQLHPILPTVKLDTKGLSSEGEKVRDLALQVVQDTGKSDIRSYPVATLHAYCTRRQYSPPIFELLEESGPPHKKLFIMRCLVNNIWYQPTIRSPNKKQAKHLAATVCLQAFGLLPKDPAKIQLRVEMPETTNDNQ